MSKNFKIAVTHTETNEVERHVGEFPDVEWERLRRFQASAHRLARCRLAISQSELRWNVSGGQDRPFTVSATFPPEDDILAFLHLMRPFVLKKEDTYFYSIVRLLAKRIPLASFRRHVELLRRRFAGEALGFHIEVGTESGITRLTSEEATLRWLNAFEYHQFADKRAEVEALYSVFPQQGTRAVFLSVMLSAAAAVGSVARMIDGFDAPLTEASAG